MKKVNLPAVVMLRYFNHVTNEEFQITVEDTMLYKALKTVNEIEEIYRTVYPSGLQYLDFWQGRGYPK